jgi:murein DD-endopeptidase MepM/ murein hydrolase activator NlpD
MSATRAGRWIAAMTGLIALASCVGPPTRQVQPVPATTAQRPLPPPPPRPTPPRRLAFAYRGAMTQGGLIMGVAPGGTMSLSFNGSPVPVTPDGRFVIAFDRDAGPSATLAATLDDGQIVRDNLIVSPRAWDISRLSTLPKYPVPMPEFDKIRPPELAQINASRAIRTDADGWKQTFHWPATGRISTLFGSQRIYKNGEKGSYHSGTDVAVPVGTPVLAPADGVVILATDHPFTLEGNLLMVDHGMGINSAFMHLSRILVHVGDHIHQGETIALSGATGRVTGPHLHWGLKWRDARIDPLLVAGPMPGQSGK